MVELSLPAKVLIGVSSGIVLGLIIFQVNDEQARKQIANYVSIPGNLWLRSLQLVVLPMLFSNMVGTSNTLKSLADSGKLGRYAITYYMTTTFLASIIGVGVGLVAYSFVGEYEGGSDTAGGNTGDIQNITTFEQIESMLFSMVPSNIFFAMSDSNLLGCIVFAFILGYVLPSTSLIVKITGEINEACFAVIGAIIAATPVGVCFLIAPQIVGLQASALLNAGILSFALLIGFLVHALIVYPMLYFVMTRKSPFTYYKGIGAAVLTAFGTASSAATLPVTLTCVQDLGVPETVAKFVCTVGATCNMDGSAIYFPIAVLWLAATAGKTVSVMDVVTIIFMSTLAAIGASPIPSSGLVMVKLILDSVGLGTPVLFSVVVGLDAFFDRGCTMVNIIGDAVAAGIVANLLGDDATKMSPDVAADGPATIRNSLRHDMELRGSISSKKARSGALLAGSQTELAGVMT
jgi:Na+/H+-dicarboxylate symporter